MGMVTGVLGTLGTLGASTWGQLLPPPRKFEGEIRETFSYTKFPTPQWWNPLQGRPVRVRDFDVWQGATAVWRGLFSDGNYVPGTGFPVLVIRIERDLDASSEPSPSDYPAPLPEGFGLYYDEEPSDENDQEGVRIVALFDRCVHLCCYPGWHVVEDPPPSRAYRLYTDEEPPTYRKYGQDPVYCVCHGSQFEPMSLVVNTNEKNGARYIGAKRVHGPAHRALPLVPVRSQNGELVGGMADPRWYVYCA